MFCKQNYLRVCVFIMVFFSSIVGGQFFGVSLNKVCMIPLILYLIAHSKNCLFKKSLFPLAGFYLIGAFSAIVSLIAPYADDIEGYVSRSVFYAIQMVILFIPMLILLSGSEKKDAILDYTVESVVLTSRINIIIVFLEFVSYFIVDVTFANSLLGLIYGIDNAVALINLPGIGIFLRPAGLNMDPAYLGIILVFGFLFEKNTIWKMLGFAAAACAMSRSSILIIVLLAIFSYVKKNGIRKIKPKYIAITVLCIVAVGVAVQSIPSLSSQITGMLSRLHLGNEMKSEDVGTMRHMLYIPKSIEVFLFHYNPIQQLIGFGPRLSGTIIAQANVMNSYLNPEMFHTAWTIECDIAELLLGYGLIGFVLYYCCIFKLRRIRGYGKMLFLVLFLYSIMYDISASTYAQFVLMVFLSCALSITWRNRKGDSYAESERNSQLLQ